MLFLRLFASLRNDCEKIFTSKLFGKTFFLIFYLELLLNLVLRDEIVRYKHLAFLKGCFPFIIY